MEERAPGVSASVWSETALRAFWERELDFPEHYFSVKYGDRIIAEMRRHISAGDKVLDYGCGRGALSERLCHDTGAEVWATDKFADAVATTSRLNASHPRFQGSFELDEYFDVIVGVEVLEHLTDSALRDFFVTAHSLLRPGGYLITTTPNRERLESKEVLCPSCGVVFHRWQHVRSVDAGQLAGWGAAAGFALMRALETDFSRAGSRFSWPRLRRRSQPDSPHLMGVFMREPFPS